MYFLFLVAVEDSDPLVDHVIQGRDTVGIDLVVVRTNHPVRPLLDGIGSCCPVGVADIPIDGFFRSVRVCLCLRRVGEVHQQVAAFDSQLRDNAVDDIVLGISEGVVDLRTQCGLLSGNEVIGLAVCGRTRTEHLHDAGIDSRLTHLEEAVGDDGHGVEPTGQLTDRRSVEHIGGCTYILRHHTRRSGDTVVGGDGVVVHVSPTPVMADRNRDGEQTRGLEIRTHIRTGSLRSGHCTYVLRHLNALHQRDIYAHVPVVALAVAEGVGRTGIYPGCRTHTGRVADDIQQHDGTLGIHQATALEVHTADESAEDGRLHGVALGLEQGADVTQGTCAAVVDVYLIHREPYGAVLTFLIERELQRIHLAMQAVVDGHFAATLRHAIHDTAVAVVVIIVLLVRPCHELVLTSAEEDRIAHQVVDRSVRLLGVHRHFVALRTDGTELHLRLAVALALDAVEDLRQADHNGVVVDTVIDSVVGGGVLLIAVRIGGQRIMDDGQRCVRQVEGLSTLTGCKERRVARSRSLYHFIFRREQIHGVFTRLGVGLENDTFLLKEGVGRYRLTTDC